MLVANGLVRSVLVLAVGLLQAAASAANAENREPAASAASTVEMATREANKKTVLAFYEAIVKLDFAAARQHVGDYYIEHDPEREDGLPGLQRALDFDRRHLKRKRVVHDLVVADGDFVAVYSKLTTSLVGPPPDMPLSRASGAGDPPPGPPAAMPAGELSLVGDIFRLQNGKIVEHWNAIVVP